MIQDANNPHHAANMTGKVHEDYDSNLGAELAELNGFGTCMCPDGSPFRTTYDVGRGWSRARCVGTCPDGRPAELVSLDEYLQFGLDDLFGSKVHPRSRHQVCAQLGIDNSQLLPGTNNWSSVVHLFTGAARKSYDNLKPRYDMGTSMRMIRNGTIDTMKLILCAEPMSPMEITPPRLPIPGPRLPTK